MAVRLLMYSLRDPVQEEKLQSELLLLADLLGEGASCRVLFQDLREWLSPPRGPTQTELGCVRGDSGVYLSGMGER